MYIETIYRINNGRYEYSDRHEYIVRFVDATKVDVVVVDMRADLTVVQDVLTPVLIFLLDKMPKAKVFFKVNCVRHYLYFNEYAII